MRIHFTKKNGSLLMMSVMLAISLITYLFGIGPALIAIVVISSLPTIKISTN